MGVVRVHKAFFIAGGLACAGLAGCGTRTSLEAPGGAVLINEAGPSNQGTPNLPALSCAKGGPGVSDCGAARESCCASSKISGATFHRTYTNTGGGLSGEADPASVSDFSLDKFLVTVGRFRRFVQAWNDGYQPAPGAGKHAHLNGGRGLADASQPGSYETGWLASYDAAIAPTDANFLACGDAYSTWTPSVGSRETSPINCITWYEAYAFCIWDGGFLPSEAEWEYAAGGGTEEREYPWGSTPPGTNNEYAIYGYFVGFSPHCYYPDGSVCSGAVNIAPVGTATLGAGRWGQVDLEGDLLQWTMDLYAPYVNPCTDCAYLSGDGDGVFRGGLFGMLSTNLQPPSRYFDPRAPRSYTVGFRCARSP
jgi:formylglycine-generating enzyme required for sulfatase activity